MGSVRKTWWSFERRLDLLLALLPAGIVHRMVVWLGGTVVRWSRCRRTKTKHNWKALRVLSYVDTWDYRVKHNICKYKPLNLNILPVVDVLKWNEFHSNIIWLFFFLAIKGSNFANMVTAFWAICQLFQFLTQGAKSYRVKRKYHSLHLLQGDLFLYATPITPTQSHTRQW